MKSLLTIGLSIAFLTTLNFFSTKYNFLLDKKVLPHKLFTSKEAVPLIKINKQKVVNKSEKILFLIK